MVRARAREAAVGSPMAGTGGREAVISEDVRRDTSVALGDQLARIRSKQIDVSLKTDQLTSFPSATDPSASAPILSS